MNVINHNQLIQREAKKALLPLGIKQKGKSRTWYYDNHWFLVLIEFQPSSWSRGSYLNVGINLLWDNHNDFFSFDIGYRIDNFHKFKDKEQFSEVLKIFFMKISACLSEYLNKFKSPSDFVDYYKSLPYETIWSLYHLFISSGLAEDTLSFESAYDKLISLKTEFEWEKKLIDDVKEMHSDYKKGVFKKTISKMINFKRVRLKLNPIDYLDI